jgi:hypothetical protein
MVTVLAALVLAAIPAASSSSDAPVVSDRAMLQAEDVPRLKLELSSLQRRRTEVPMALGITLLVLSAPLGGAGLALIFIGFQEATKPANLLFFGVAPFLPYLTGAVLLGVASAICSLTGINIINNARSLDSQIEVIQEQLANPMVIPKGPKLRF